MNKLSLLFCLLFVYVIYGQSKKGYYVTIDGHRVEGSFLETNYLDAATLKFKTDSDKNFQNLDTRDVKEFGIGREFKAEKFVVEIDVTDAGQGQISTNREAIWEKQVLFLNVIVEGNASLYMYSNGNGTKYFYKVEGKQANPEQLLYRKYMSGDLKTSENNKFRQQLYTDLNCTGTNDINKFLKIPYTQKDISQLFEEYNTCKNSKSRVYNDDSAKKKNFYYNVFAGLYASKFNVEGAARTFDNDNYASFGVGGEIVVMLSGKFGLFAKAEYESINAKLINVFSSPYGGVTKTTTIYDVKGGIFNFDLGSRYYFNINQTNTIYIDAALVIAVPLTNLDGNVTVYNGIGEPISVSTGQQNLESAIAGNFGLGYTLNNKYSIEAHYITNRDFFNKNSSGGLGTNSSRFGVSLKYTLN